MSENTD